MVLVVPPADEGVFNGSIVNRWQAAIEDIGPGGVDKGTGGKYLILPPGYKDNVPAGYIPMRSDSYLGYALIRSVLKSGSEADVAKAVAYSKRMQLYPLSQADNPSATPYIDAVGVLFDSTIPYDMRFFESLDRMVQAEPWLERDKVMIDPLKTIGIEKGKSFRPDPKTQQILINAMQEAKAWFEARYEMLPPFYEGKHWFFPSTAEMIHNVMSDWRVPDSYPIDARGTAYALAFFSQASGRVAVLLADRQRQGRQAAGRQGFLSSARAGKRARHPILVDDGVRPRHTRLHQEYALGRPLFADTRAEEKRGRFGRYLLRSEPAVWARVQLDTHRFQRTLRGARTLLRSKKGALRQDMGPAGHRTISKSMKVRARLVDRLVTTKIVIVGPRRLQVLNQEAIRLPLTSRAQLQDRPAPSMSARSPARRATQLAKPAQGTQPGAT